VTEEERAALWRAQRAARLSFRRAQVAALRGNPARAQALRDATAPLRAWALERYLTEVDDAELDANA
jgi:hypothetical protein